MKLSEYLSEVGQPFAYYPSIAKVVGGMKEGILVCQLVWWHRQISTEWLKTSQEELMEATAFSKHEQRSARASLRALGLIEEEYRAADHKLYVRVVFERLDELWEERRASPRSGLGQSENRTGGQSKIRTGPVRKSDQISPKTELGQSENRTSSILGTKELKRSKDSPPHAVEAVSVWPSGERPEEEEGLPAGTPVDEHKRAIALFTEAHLQDVGSKYVFVGARDGKAVKMLLKAGATPERIVEVARAAWKLAGQFPFTSAGSLSGLYSKWNEITAALSRRGDRAVPKAQLNGQKAQKAQHVVEDMDAALAEARRAKQ